MRKTNQVILSLLFFMLGALNASALETSLEEIPFWTHEVWGVDEPKTTPANREWVIGEPSGIPYGDSSVNNFADLSQYAKLVVVVTEGSPRFLFNRDADDGQFNDNEAESHLIDNTRGGWCAKYFSSTAGENEGETIHTVDLKQMVKDKGFAHLHAIKGANWENVTVQSMVVISSGKIQQIGWTNLINNGDMEGLDSSSFFAKISPDDTPSNAEISDGIGVDGSRGIMVAATDKVKYDYDNQFWFRFNEPLIAGTKYRVSFSYRADEAASVATQAHAEPTDYIHSELLGSINFTSDWQTFEKEGEVTEQQAGPNSAGNMFQSVAFNLNPDNHTGANNYYFDNIKFEVYKVGTLAEFSNDVILVNFGFDTNIPELVAQSGAKRVFFDNSCATVKVNGEKAEIYSIEGLEDGRFYIFMVDAIDDNATVEVSVVNSMGLSYTSGPNTGSPVDDFTGIAAWNGEIEENEGYPYDYVTPSVMKTDPDEGSFNLPTSTSFTIYFDKNVDCAALEASANGSSLTVKPSEGFAKEVTLSGSLSEGECVVSLTKIYPEMRLDDTIFGEYQFKVSIGKTSSDPSDQPYDLIPAEYFANCAENAIPEGYYVMFGEEARPGQSTYSGGSRMFNFAAGGDFTKGLYFREGYVEYGSTAGYELTLEAGKKYVISFNSARWKASGSTLDLKILDAEGNEVFSQTINNNPDMNGQKSAVTGSTKTEINFVPETSGNYTVRWDRPGFNEVLIGNVEMKYMPNVTGLEYILMLNKALEEAKKTLEENSGERYDGEAFTNLKTVIGNYDGWESTSPTAYKEAVAAIEVATQALKDHRANCDEYDTQIKKAIDVVRQNRENKFSGTELYTEIVGVVAKYNGSSEWVNVGDEQTEEWQLKYSYDILKDDAQLIAAIAELKDIANTTSLLFTEGVSAPEGANGGKQTGIAVLTDRLRMGADALVSEAIGVAETDPDVQAARNALTDDDAIADRLKNRLKKRVYNELNNPNTTLFVEKVDEVTAEAYTEPVDMTVFVKAPNIYKQRASMEFNAENVPGWTTPEGYKAPGLTVGWGQPKGNDQIAEDVMFQTWGNSYRVEQTINDLPVGIYTVRFAFGERNNGDSGVFAESYAYVTNPGGEEFMSPSLGTNDNGEEMFIPGIGQAFPFASNDNQSAVIEGVEVADGTLTIGVNAGPSSHTFFNEVRLLMTAPLPGFIYPTFPESVHGDVNGDGAVNVADISAIISEMAGDADYKGMADVNADGSVDVADISVVITTMAENARLKAGDFAEE